MPYEDIPTQNEEDAVAEPAWLIHKLQLAGEYTAFTSDNQSAVSDEFRSRAREEAEIAFTLNKLRAECMKIGFLPMSIGSYVQGIAKVTNLSLSATFGWLGISNIFYPDPQSAEGFARLGLELGLSLSEIMTQVRIAIAPLDGDFPITILMARYRSGASERNDLQVCISVLEEIESKYDQQILNDLLLIEAGIRAVYQQESQ
jgi:hypothetical protein